MPLNQMQLDQFRELFRHPFETKRKIDNIVDILLGDICGASDGSLKRYLKQNGISDEEFRQMTADQQFETFKTILKKRGTKTDNVIAALDMIFSARYGWPEGTAGKITLAQTLEALEHATEYDAPSKPSIWEITK